MSLVLSSTSLPDMKITGIYLLTAHFDSAKLGSL